MDIVINYIHLSAVQVYSGSGFLLLDGKYQVCSIQYTVQNGYHELSGRVRIKFDEYKKLKHEDIMYKIEKELNMVSVDDAK
ncbi:hypothetical protein [Bacillus toyonensis]|uniref:hypothetical protein n=1 Tax=Bacillus toyonensis TaxID=155322 RepID=UPI003D645D96